jgi:hypothetical protein
VSYEQIQVCSCLIARGLLVLSSPFKCDASLMLRLPPNTTFQILSAAKHPVESCVYRRGTLVGQAGPSAAQ